MGRDTEGANVCLIACGRVSTRFYVQVHLGRAARTRFLDSSQVSWQMSHYHIKLHMGRVVPDLNIKRDDVGKADRTKY